MGEVTGRQILLAYRDAVVLLYFRCFPLADLLAKCIICNVASDINTLCILLLSLTVKRCECLVHFVGFVLLD